jgi:lysozyme
MTAAKILSPLRAVAFALTAVSMLAGCSQGIVAEHSVVIRPAKSAFTTTHPHDFSLHGIDVSKYQGDIDWQAVKQAGIAFAYIKATEGGNHIDSKFQANWDGARAAGVPRGAYHFVWWCRPAIEEVNWFKEVVPRDPDALPPVLDVEATPTSRTCKRRLDRDSAVRDMRVMLQEMERYYGKRPVIYTTVDFYEAILSNNELSEYPIWVRSTKYSPHVKYGSRKWAFWQYQSDAVVPGIRTLVDRNAFHGDRATFLAFASGRRSAPPERTLEPIPADRIIPETEIAAVEHPRDVPAKAVVAASTPVRASLAPEPMALMPPASLPNVPFPPQRY